jgi:polyhydroxybutyrate depolymerase
MTAVNMMKFASTSLSLLCLLLVIATAQTIPFGSMPYNFRILKLDVDGVERQAMVRIPDIARQSNAPVVFVFHGHGGNARAAARSFNIHEEWPEAVFVFMQGLNTPGKLTDPEGKLPGWQNLPGVQGDRDLKFFDTLFARLKTECRVDTNRVFATGHSNGGGFTYLLWSERPALFSAFAPSAAAVPYVARLKPKPAMHLAGEDDRLVKFSWQQLTMNAVRRVNQCTNESQPWGDSGKLYPSTSGAPFLTLIHSGGHELHPQAGKWIVKFFKEQSALKPAP